MHGTSWQALTSLLIISRVFFVTESNNKTLSQLWKAKPALVLQVADSRCLKARLSNSFSSLGNCKVGIKTEETSTSVIRFLNLIVHELPTTKYFIALENWCCLNY